MLPVIVLVVGSAAEDLSFHGRAFEGAADDGDDRAGAVRRVTDGVGAGTVHMQFDDEFQAGSFGIRRFGDLCTEVSAQQGSKNQGEDDFLGIHSAVVFYTKIRFLAENYHIGPIFVIFAITNH